jgi:SulP family sulfate permease
MPIFLWQLFGALSEVNIPTLILGIGGILTLVFLKRLTPKLPRHLIVVGIGMAVIAFIPSTIAVVGQVPKGLPDFSSPLLSWNIIISLMEAACTISLVAFLEAYSVALQTRGKEDPILNPNEELRALGLANIVGSFFQGYPVTGGFSRTAVNNEAGAKTPLAGLFTAGFVVIALLLLTPLFVFLPKAVLGAIICTAVMGLIDISSIRTLWNHDRLCWSVMMISALGTIFLGISWGIGLGITAAWTVERLRGINSCILTSSDPKPL